MTGKWIVSLIGVAIALSAAVIAVSLVNERPSGTSTHPEFGNPCAGAATTLAAARSGAVFDLIEPEAPIANSKSLASVWTCATAPGGIALVYDSGATVLESVNDLKDPTAEWKGLADSYAEFTYGEVEGVPASFADPSVDKAIGGVDLVVGDVRYTVSGNGSIPLKDLIEVARSLMIQVKPQAA